MVTVEQLYKDFAVIADAKENAGEHIKEFESILSAVKGGPSEKRLASQFIARFFKYFPSLAERAIDAQLDMCEDEDVSIRKQAIKELPTLCKETPENVSRLSDVLTQLLQTDDSSEQSLVQVSLLALCRIDAKGAVVGVFAQINQGEDVVRERAIKFLGNKLKLLEEDVFTKEVEDYVVQESRKVLQDVTGEEFVLFMKMLSSLKSMNTVQGRQQLVQIVVEQADLDKEFEASDPDCVDKLIQCVRQANPYLSKNVHSTKFVSYICDQVLPVLSQIQSVEEETETDGVKTSTTIDMQLDTLKVCAEIVQYVGADLTEVEERVGRVYSTLIEHMPLPPAEEENSENENEEPKLQFSHVECLMFAFHHLARKAPQFLTDETHADRLKDFKIRLQYFARGVQVYIRQLRVALQGKTGDALKTEENRIKVVALKITNNINILIKDLFHSPPSYKAVINLSWKKPEQKQNTQAISPGQKRPGITPITFDSDGPKGAKKDRQMYTPPSGKYSEKAGAFQDNSSDNSELTRVGGAQGGGGGGGGYRGNNRGYRGGRGRGGGYRGNRRW